MWQVLKAELNYNKLIFLGFMALVPLIYLIEVNLEDMPRYFTLILLFLMEFYFIFFSYKEKRHISQALLPLSKHEIGFARIFAIFVSSLFILIVYAAIGIYLEWDRSISYVMNYNSIMIFVGIIILIFSVFFIFMDTLVYRLKNNRYISLNNEQVRNLLIFFALVINMLGVYVNIARPKTFLKIVVFLFTLEINFKDVIILLLISLSTMIISTRTYAKRKSYI